MLMIDVMFMASHRYEELVRVLNILGSLIAIVYGIVAILNVSLQFITPPSSPHFSTFFDGIVLIVLGIVSLTVFGVNKRKSVSYNSVWILLLVFGILMFWFGSAIGGLIVVLGGLLALLDALR